MDTQKKARRIQPSNGFWTILSRRKNEEGRGGRRHTRLYREDFIFYSRDDVTGTHKWGERSKKKREAPQM